MDSYCHDGRLLLRRRTQLGTAFGVPGVVTRMVVDGMAGAAVLSWIIRAQLVAHVDSTLPAPTVPHLRLRSLGFAVHALRPWPERARQEATTVVASDDVLDGLTGYVYYLDPADGDLSTEQVNRLLEPDGLDMVWAWLERQYREEFNAPDPVLESKAQRVEAYAAAMQRGAAGGFPLDKRAEREARERGDSPPGGLDSVDIEQAPWPGG
jgi:hypothetical protein